MSDFIEIGPLVWTGVFFAGVFCIGIVLTWLDDNNYLPKWLHNILVGKDSKIKINNLKGGQRKKDES